MLYVTIIATAVLIVPGITSQYAGIDAWLSPFIASLVGFATVYIASALHKLYPGQTVIQYSQQIAGRFGGKTIGLVFLSFYLLVDGIVVREYAEFIVESFLPRTPLIVVISTMLLVAAYNVRGGIESIARSALIFTAISFVIPVAISVLLYPDLDPKELLPVMEHGITPVIQGAYVPQAWFSEFFVISFVLPFLIKPGEGRRWGFLSVFVTMAILTYTNLVLICLYGGDEASMVYPVLNAFRYISIAGFIENFESVIMATWVMSNLVKISVFYYAIVLGTAQWLKLSDYKPIVLPIGLLIAILSVWGLPGFHSVSLFLREVFPLYGTLVQTMLPLLLLIVAAARRIR